MIVTADMHLTDVASDYRLTYTIQPDGKLEVDVHYKAGVNELPRIGMLMTLSNEFDNLAYYGRGHGETTRIVNMHLKLASTRVK